MLALTRFSTETYDQNQSYRQKIPEKNRCFYGASRPFNERVDSQKFIYVLEWHLQDRKVMGVGRIQNKPDMTSKKPKVYTNTSYSRYMYTGSRIDAAELDADDLKIFTVFNQLLLPYCRGRDINMIKKPEIVQNGVIDFVAFFQDLFQNYRGLALPLSAVAEEVPEDEEDQAEEDQAEEDQAEEDQAEEDQAEEDQAEEDQEDQLQDQDEDHDEEDQDQDQDEEDQDQDQDEEDQAEEDQDEDQFLEEEKPVFNKRKREDTPRPAESYSGGKYVFQNKTNKVARK
jgi:hypothetical protein